MKFRTMLDEVVNGRELTTREALDLLTDVEPARRHAVLHAAGMVNEQLNRGIVTFVRGREVGFTNVCEMECPVCPRVVDGKSPDAFVLSHVEVIDRIASTPDVTEICVRGALNPGIGFEWIVGLVGKIHEAFPDAHIHALSGVSVSTYAERAEVSLDDAIDVLVDAGWGSMVDTVSGVPDTDAADEWVRVVERVHAHDVPSTVTLAFADGDDRAGIVRKLDTIRSLQKRTRAFIECIPAARGKNVSDDLRHLVYAVSRLFLAESVRNVRVSAGTLGIGGAVEAMSHGVNDLGAALPRADVEKLAGCHAEVPLTIEALREAVEKTGRTLRERTTLYELKAMEGRKSPR